MFKLIFFLVIIAFSVASERDLKFGDLYESRAKQIAETINNLDVGWKAEPRFTNWMYSDILKLGCGRFGHPLPQRLHLIPNLEAIPTEFDARKQWPNCPTIGHIRDQANCGSCWAIAAAEVISDRICIASNGTKVVEISTSDIVECCSYCSVTGDGCQGGYFAHPFRYYASFGIVSGGDYGNNNTCLPYFLPSCSATKQGTRPPCPTPYTKSPICEKKCSVSSYPKPYSSDKWRGRVAYQVSSRVEQIQTEIMSHGPVSAGMIIYDDWLMYKSGVYRHVTGPQVGSHAIKLLGWGVENGTPYWLCANSFNEEWGSAGFFKILRGSNECSIESAINAGLPV